jgi:hypothetical protein
VTEFKSGKNDEHTASPQRAAVSSLRHVEAYPLQAASYKFQYSPEFVKCRLEKGDWVKYSIALQMAMTMKIEKCKSYALKMANMFENAMLSEMASFKAII